MAGPPPPPRSGMSLYANLLDPNPDSPASISRAPVRFGQSDDSNRDSATSRKPLDPALRFQPIRRPQANKQVKPKPSFPKLGATAIPAAPAAAAAAVVPVAPSANPAAPAPRKLADWAAAEEDEFVYGGAEKRQRGGRRKKKKKFDERPAETDWNEIYDPSRPTNIEEYLLSDEKIREVQDWKAVLYAHRRKRRESSDTDMSDEEEQDIRPSMTNQFAPPPSYAFAPPPPPPSAPTVDPEAATGDDAYARRLALPGQAPPPPPPPTDSQPPQPQDGPEITISRAPVRYSPPPPPPPPPDSDTEMHVDHSSYILPPPPSKAGFAARIMSKYGWTKGAGLGVEGDGITAALSVQVEKRRRRPDAEGGGFAEPGGRGKIIAPKSLNQKKLGDDTGSDAGRFGKMSDVVLLQGMLEGMEDLGAEVENGLGQEIGEECGEKYGRVERVYVDVEGRQVFIKFTDQVSALRAVNALEGRIFNGNTIMPRFYDTEKFEYGVYA